jgi:anti-sigma factor RsiW
MTNKISTREWEAISAYLDGQLAPKERSRLEARLQANAELRTALDEMRRTRAVLRSQPRLRAPRNFTLTTKMVGVRPAPRGFPALRLVSAFASILLVFVLVGDLFFTAPVTSQPLPLMAQEAAPIEKSVSDATAAGNSAEAEAGEEASRFSLESPTSEALQAAPPAAAEAPTATPEAALSAQVAPETEPEAPMGAAGSAPMGGEVQPTQEAQLLLEEQPLMADSASEADQGARQSWVNIDRSVLRAVEIGLGLVAILAGLAAFYLRKAANG